MFTHLPSNLLLAADYVRTFTDLATMEGANEAARRADHGALLAVNAFTGLLHSRRPGAAPAPPRAGR